MWAKKQTPRVIIFSLTTSIIKYYGMYATINIYDNTYKYYFSSIDVSTSTAVISRKIIYCQKYTGLHLVGVIILLFLST